MHGRWLAKFGSWVARKETFERIVGPAIADMQIESAYGSLHRWKHYFAISAVLAHALLWDVRLDVASAFDAEARHVAWKRAAIWYAAFVAFFTFVGVRYNRPSSLTMAGLWPAALTSAVIEAMLTFISLGLTVAVFYLWRRSQLRRSIAAVVLPVAVLTIALAFAVRPIRVSADRALYDAIQTRISASTAERWKAGSLNESANWWQDIQNGVSVIPGTLTGIILSRRRGWKEVAFTYTGMHISTLILFVFILGSLGIFSPKSLTMERWAGIGLNFAVAAIWLVFDARRRRARRFLSSTVPPA